MEKGDHRQEQGFEELSVLAGEINHMQNRARNRKSKAKKPE